MGNLCSMLGTLLNCFSTFASGFNNCVQALFVCRMMDNMPANNMGQAVNDYAHCLCPCLYPTTIDTVPTAHPVQHVELIGKDHLHSDAV